MENPPDDGHIYVVIYNKGSENPRFAVFPTEKEAHDHFKKPINTKAVKASKKEEPLPVAGFESLMQNALDSFLPYYMLATMAPRIGPMMAKQVVVKEVIGNADKNFIEIKSEKNKSIYKADEKSIAVLNKSLAQAKEYHDAFAVLPNSVLMSIVSTFDAHLTEIAKFGLRGNKDRIINSNREIKAKDIFSYDNFEDLLDSIIDEDIYKIMWESHSVQVLKFEEIFKVKIKEHFDHWAEFIEVFERRNLAAHGQPVATRRYHLNCKEQGCNLDGERVLKVGSKLDLNAKYLRSSTDLLLLFLIVFIFNIWVKQDKEGFSKAYRHLNSIAFKLMCEKRHTLASRILRIAVNWKDQNIPEDVRRMMVINLANAYKFLENDEESQKTLKIYQWAASSANYRVCEASIRGDVKTVNKLMPIVKADDSISKDDFRTWPVFEWIRQDEDFLKQFKTVFEEEFSPSTR